MIDPDYIALRWMTGSGVYVELKKLQFCFVPSNCTFMLQSAKREFMVPQGGPENVDVLLRI